MKRQNDSIDFLRSHSEVYPEFIEGKQSDTIVSFQRRLESRNQRMIRKMENKVLKTNGIDFLRSEANEESPSLLSKWNPYKIESAGLMGA